MLQATFKQWTTVLAALTATTALLLAPARFALWGRQPTCMQDVETLDDAVALCRHSGLSGWDLVIFAQRLVCRKFIRYSCRNLWDTPAQAFRYGMGCCTQYNLALQQILHHLDIETSAVFSLRVYFFDNREWTMGHTWLAVRIQGEERAVLLRPDLRGPAAHSTHLANTWCSAIHVDRRRQAKAN